MEYKLYTKYKYTDGEQIYIYIFFFFKKKKHILGRSFIP